MSRLREIQLETPTYWKVCLEVLHLLAGTAYARGNIDLCNAAWARHGDIFAKVHKREPPRLPFAEITLPDLTAPCLFVTGEPGAGKTYAIKMALRSFPDLFPGYGDDEADCPIVTFNAASHSTLKGLGTHMLADSGLTPRTTLSEPATWQMLAENWEETGRLIIHIDDSYRIGRSMSVREFDAIRDKLAELQDWIGKPFGLLISGTPETSRLFETEGGVHRRLESTVFVPPMTNEELQEDLLGIIQVYADKYELKVDIPNNTDFIFRHGHASMRAFGRSIEYIMAAVQIALFSADRTVRQESFAEALERRYGWPPDANPYVVADWGRVQVDKVLQNARPSDPSDTAPGAKRNRRS